MSQSRRYVGQQLLASLALVCSACAAKAGTTLPACDAPEVQEVAQKAAAESVKIPFALSAFSEVKMDSTDTRRACRVRAKHAASGAAIWLRFTLERRAAKKTDAAKDDKKNEAKEPAQELAVVFAPIE